MAILRYLLPAFAVVGNVLAQNGCSADENIIQNQGDADALRGCSTIDGDIVIAPQTANSISLGGIQSIKGSLRCEDATNLTGIRADQLGSIEKEFKLKGLVRLGDLRFPSLESVGTINWEALPALERLSFTREVSEADEVIITNTNLNRLDGINLLQVNTIDINNNLYLSNIELDLRNISRALIIQANSEDLEVSFPSLEWAFNMTFIACRSVNLPKLAAVNGSMAFLNGTMETISAPQLKGLGRDGSLVMSSNPSVTNISFPSLEVVGGSLQIGGSPEIEVIDGFPKLNTVAGALDLRGSFTEVDMPELKEIRGRFSLRTSGQFDCKPFDDLRRRRGIRGTYQCEPGQETPGDNPSATSGESEATPSGIAGAVEANLGAAMGLSAFVAGLFVAL